MSPYRNFFVERNTEIINHHILPVNIVYKSINNSEIGANTAPPHHAPFKAHSVICVMCVYLYLCYVLYSSKCSV